MPVQAGRPFRHWLFFLSALALAAVAVATSLVACGAGASLRLAHGWLNADLIVVPAGWAESVARGLLLGEPVPARLAYDSAQCIAAIPGVAAASPQLYLSCPERGAACALPGVFLVAYDPATDFTLRPLVDHALPQGLGPESAVGGSAIAVPPGEDSILVYGYPLRLAANLPPTGTGLDRSLFITLEAAHRLAGSSFASPAPPLAVPLTRISAVTVRLRPGSDPQAVAAEIERQMPWAASYTPAQLLAPFSRRVQAAWPVLGTSVAALVGYVALARRRQAKPQASAMASSLAAGAGLGVALGCLVATLGRQQATALLGVPYLLPPLRLRLLLAGGGAIGAVAAAGRAARRPALPTVTRSFRADDG